MRARHLGAAFLVPAGALVGHAAAYGLGGGHGNVAPDHGYLAGAATVAGPLALVGLVWQAWLGARGSSCPSLRLLVVTQSAVFVGQEALEHVLGGHGLASLVQSSAVRVGVAAQVVVAALAMVLVRAARATGRAVAAAMRRRPQTWKEHDSAPRLGATLTLPPSQTSPAVSERGPPSLLVFG